MASSKEGREIELKFVIVNAELDDSKESVIALDRIYNKMKRLMGITHQAEFVSHFYTDVQKWLYDGARISRVERLIEDGAKVSASDPNRVFGLANWKTPIGGGKSENGFSDSVAAIEKEELISASIHDSFKGSIGEADGAALPHVSKLRVRTEALLSEDQSVEIEYDFFFYWPSNDKFPTIKLTAEVEIQDLLPNDLSDQKATAEIIRRTIKCLSSADSDLSNSTLSSYSNRDMAAYEDSEWNFVFPHTLEEMSQLLEEAYFKHLALSKVQGRSDDYDTTRLIISRINDEIIRPLMVVV